MALAAVLLLHAGAALLLLRPTAQPPAQDAGRTLLRLIALPPATKPVRAQPAPAASSSRPRAIASPRAISLPALNSHAEELNAAESPAPSAAAAPAAPPAPLDLRLPARVATPNAPSLAEQIRADSRANSPRESAAERMANALGAKGWTVVELSDGGRKVTGPFGECQIIRPSMVDSIPGHPHAGLLPPRVFGCGGIEKGSLKHERPR